MTHTVGFFVFPDFQILDLTGPLAAFQAANMASEAPPYRLHVVSMHGGGNTSTAGLEVATTAMNGAAFDTLIIVGGRGSRIAAQSPDVLAAVQEAAGRSERMASVCTGAFVLASAGLLNGRCATTHWRRAAALQRQYPQVNVHGDRIFVKDGSIWTSAGVTAGIDLALAMIEEDLGVAASRAVACELVVYHRRPGGQSQFSVMQDLEPASDRVCEALTYAREHLHERLPVERLAAVACLSLRQFGRAFRTETGETPARAVERLRAEAARIRVEEGNERIESIATSVGFRDPERMRRAFLRTFGLPPQAIRRAAKSNSVGSARKV